MVGPTLRRAWTRGLSEVPSNPPESEHGRRDGVKMHQHAFAMDRPSSDLG